MSNFKMGIAVPVTNHRFEEPTYVSMTIKAATAVGATYLDVNLVNPSPVYILLSQLFQRGDVIVATSTSTAYSGETEHLEVDYILGSKIYLQSATTKTYEIGDVVYGNGTGWPEGWLTGGGTWNKFSNTTIKPNGGGKSGDYALRLDCNYQPTDEMITNGGFNGSTGWTAQKTGSNGWTISRGKASLAVTSGTGSYLLYQDFPPKSNDAEISFIQGNSYSLSFTVSDYSAGGVIFRTGSHPYTSLEKSANGTYNVIFTCVESSATLSFVNGGITTLSIYNISCKLVSNASERTTGVIVSQLTYPLNEYCVYRMGYYLKNNISKGSGLPYKVADYLWDGITYSQTGHSSETQDNTYTEYNHKALTQPNLSDAVDARRKIQFDIFSPSANNQGKTTSYFSDVYLEHARGIDESWDIVADTETVREGSTLSISLLNYPISLTTNDEVLIWGKNTDNKYFGAYGVVAITNPNSIRVNIRLIHWESGSTINNPMFVAGSRVEKFGNGYYTFTEYPEQQTAWEKEEALPSYRTTNNSLKTFNISGRGERTTKYVIKLTYTNVDYTFYKTLRKFEEACLRGDLLNLHLEDNFPEISRGFLQGVLSLSGFKHDMYDRTKVSFTFTFTEA